MKTRIYAALKGLSWREGGGPGVVVSTTACHAAARWFSSLHPRREYNLFSLFHPANSMHLNFQYAGYIMKDDIHVQV